MIKNSIKAKNFLLFIFFSLLPSFIIIIYIIIKMQAEMESNIQEKMITATVNLEQYLNNYISDIIQPTAQRIQESLESIEKLGISNTEKLIGREIERKILLAVYLYSEDGQLVYEQVGKEFSDKIDKTRLKNFIDTKVLSPIHNKNKENYGYFTTKDSLNTVKSFFYYTDKLSFDNKRIFQEVCITDIKNRLFDKVIKNGISSALSILLYDEQNQLIYKHIAQGIQEDKVNDFMKKIKNNYNKEMIKNKPLRLLRQLDIDKNRYLVMSNFSPENKLLTISFIPTNIAFAHIYQLEQFVLWHLFILIITILIVNYYLISILLKPLKKLKESAAEAGKGNLKVKVKVKSNDEIGQLAITFNKMIKELDRFNQININKIIAEKLKLQKIIEEMGDGVIVVNKNDEIIIINNQICGWFSCRKKEAIGKKFSNLPYFSQLFEIYQNVKNNNNGEILYKEFKREINEKMETIYLQASTVKIQTDRKNIIGVSIVIRNITKDKEIIKLKDNMITFVAHELRSPLVSIIGFSEYLKAGGIPEKEAKEFANIIFTDGKKMLNFINDFLDLSKLERGVSQLTKSPIEIRQYLLDKLEDYKSKIVNKNIQLNTVFCDKKIETQTYVRLFDIIIDNYITNAIKYSPKNTTITVVLDCDDNFFRFEVIDQGYGIEEKDLPKIFDNFFRVESNPKIKNITGTGMGLALVKKSAQQMGGYVYVESEIEKGSKFGVALPVEKEDNNQLTKLLNK